MRNSSLSDAVHQQEPNGTADAEFFLPFRKLEPFNGKFARNCKVICSVNIIRCHDVAYFFGGRGEAVGGVHKLTKKILSIINFLAYFFSDLDIQI
jgi:hypothetical protein